jgi:pimeloyl-ACP methyl ester carboxylesterase
MEDHKKYYINSKEFIAYNKFEPRDKDNKPGIVFLSGFMSDMQGSKAVFLEELCKLHEISYVRFDYSGHGSSSGKFEEKTITDWKEDVINIVDEVADKNRKHILIGSSMGGWLMCLAALERKERIKSLIGIAAAPDFTENLIWNNLDIDAQKQILENGIYNLPTDECSDPSNTEQQYYPITRELIEDGRNSLLLDKEEIDISCTVRLIHGMDDMDVPYETSMELGKKLKADDVEIILSSSSGHRMSNDRDLRLLKRVVESCIMGE